MAWRYFGTLLALFFCCTAVGSGSASDVQPSTREIYDGTLSQSNDTRQSSPAGSLRYGGPSLLAGASTRSVQSPQPGARKENDEIARLKLRILELQNAGKLGFRKIVLCSRIDGFGRYSPVKKGQKLSKILLYFEPFHVSTLVSKDRYVIDCSVDVYIVDGRGKVMAVKKGLPLNRVSRTPVMDLYFKVALRLKKKNLKHGLLIRAVLHDRIKGESVAGTYRLKAKPSAPPKEKIDAA